ncbi:MAG: type II toxin-antitoxin system ParD family antitoxin [Aestuariivirga sp.]
MSNVAEKISITVTPAMKRVLEERVASGEFASASELMREAFRTWQKQQDEHQERLAVIRARIQQSIDDPRPNIPAQDVFDNLKKVHEKKLKAASRSTGS